MKLDALFRILPFTNPSGKTAYRVTGSKPGGARIRENYKTEAEAVGRKQSLENEILNLPVVPLRATHLTPEQIADAETAASLIAGKSNLTGIARFWLDNYHAAVQVKPIAPALLEFIAAKQSENCRPDTIRNLRDRVGRFARSSGAEITFDKTANTNTILQHGKNLSEILPDAVREFIHTGGTPENKNNERRALNNFFNWCQRRGYCAENPVTKIDTIQLDDSEPVTMSVDRSRRFMRAAESFKGGKLVPYTALSLFGALRPKELLRLSREPDPWTIIKLNEKIITLGSKLAKMRQRRIIEMPDNLIQWLKPHAAQRSPIIPKNFRKDLDTIKATAGYSGANRKGEKTKSKLEPMAQDILRHTAISHHLALHEHEGKTAKWAGNSPDIIQRHYKGLFTAKEAADFFNIRPAKTRSKIIQLRPLNPCQPKLKGNLYLARKV